MPAKRAQSVSTQTVSAKTTTAGATPNDPVSLFAQLLTGTNHKALVSKLVSHLRSPSYSVVNFVHDAAETKKQSVATEMPLGRLVDSWARLDRTVEDCLTLALVPHEKFINNTLHAFCEFDQAGCITFANAKMQEWAPRCVGKVLATLFGKAANEVRKVLAASDQRRLHQLELNAGGARYATLAEFGKIDAKGPVRGYALFVDMTELVDAEHKALEAAPHAMLKVDANYRVLYANKKAQDLFEMEGDELIGRDPRQFISGEKSKQEVARQSEERKSGRGGQYDAEFRRPKSRQTINVRITSVPYFNPAGEFSGALASLQPIDCELSRKEIAQLIATQTDYEKLFARLLEIIKRFIPFEWADLAMYTRERDYAFSFLREGGDPYQIKWWPIAPKYYGFIDQPFPYIADMVTFLSQTPEGRLELKKPEMQNALKEGRKAILAFPIRRAGRIIGALSLQSKQVGRYHEGDYQILDELAVDQALQAIFNLRESASRNFVFDLLRKISAATDHKELAETLVGELARFYKFQNVSIFKINAWRGNFSLLAQKLGDEKNGVKITDDYVQPLDLGLLGLTYERGENVHLQDIDDQSEESKRFLKVDRNTKSELCIPIKLRGRILWILNFEDSRKNAFAAPEIERIEDIVKQVDAAVDRLFQGLVLTQVLQEFPDGVVIAGKGGKVFLCNDDAQRLFETESDPAGVKLSTFLSQSDLATALSEQASPTWKTEVRGIKGKKTTVLMSKYLLPQEYDHVVLRLQDVTELEWKGDIERLRAALAEATSQVRIPLSLASSYIQQIARKANNDRDVIDLVGKTIRQLSRIELTYDRVFASYDANKLPGERKVPVDINRVIDHILNQLPDGDRRIVKFTPTEVPGRVMADTYRLLFALESMLTYLLRSRASSNEVNLNISSPNRTCIDIVLDGAVASREIIGELDQLVEATRMEIALGERLLKRIAAESGGTFTRQQQPDGREQLTLRLKLTPTRPRELR